MNGRSAGGLVLLLVGSLALIGYLTGNLDRWLGYLFAPPGSGTTTLGPDGAGKVLGPPVGHAGATIAYPPGGNARGTYVS